MIHGGNILLYGILFILIIDGIWWLFIKEDITRTWLKIVYWLVTTTFVLSLIVYNILASQIDHSTLFYSISGYAGLVVIWYLPKLLYITIRLIALPISLIGERCAKAIKSISLILATILFAACIYGFTAGRYAYKVNEFEIPIKNITSDLIGVKIAHISDLHLGSFPTDYKGIDIMVEEINKHNVDLVLITGDMVNGIAEEMVPYIPVLKQIKSRYGVYSILGDHDNGIYISKFTDTERFANRRRLIEYQNEAGIELLSNESVNIPIGRDTLYLIGVDLESTPDFNPVMGKPVILMVYDPSYWRGQVLNQSADLTLSGKTHAMQMGFKIGNIEWSPAQYLYNEYDGLHQMNGYYLNVSRGIGYIGIPGRVGLRPVIDIITLKK